MKHSTQRDKQVRRVILIEGSANLLVLILKTIVGLSTGSMAILADAVHSLTDLTNNVIAWFVIHFSSLPADREHPYGHRKFEAFATLAIAYFSWKYWEKPQCNKERRNRSSDKRH